MLVAVVVAHGAGSVRHALAVTKLSDTLAREEDGSAINGHIVGVTRWSEAEDVRK